MRFCMLLIALFLITLSVQAALFVDKDFEDGALAPQLSVDSTGTFNQSPGIYDQSFFGSSKAFCFGYSTKSSSAFENYTTDLTVELTAPIHISTIELDVAELDGNWGSYCNLIVNGLPINLNADGYSEDDNGDTVGASPVNDGNPDSAPRHLTWTIDDDVTNLYFHAGDITTSSAIWIDNLQISVPEPSSILFLLVGIGGYLLRVRYRPRYRC